MQPPHQYGPPPYGPAQYGPAPVHKYSNVITVRRGVALAVLGGLAFVSCGMGAAVTASDPAATSARPTVTTTVTVTAKAKRPAAAAAAPAASSPTAAARVKLPALVGKNGAIAQDTLERLGFTNVQFASGDQADGSVVVLPANWKVTKMEPRAGTRVRPGDLVVLTAVKVG